MVQQYQESSVNQKQAKRQLAKILVICNTLEIKPEKLVSEDNVVQNLKSIMNRFVTQCKEGNIKHTKRFTDGTITNFKEYESALRNFVSHFQYVPPKTLLLPKEVEHEYPAELTDDEINRMYLYFNSFGDKRFLVMAMLQHEIFCRFDSLLNWKVEYQIKTDVVDGVNLRYAKLNFFESKQKKSFEKIVLDKRVLQILEKQNIGEKIVNTNKEEFSKDYFVKLRQFYFMIGKLDAEKEYAIGDEGWYWKNRPTHCLRKSGAHQSLRRCNMNYDLVSAMGWNDSRILKKTYAQVKISLESNICEKCNPSKSNQENKLYCSFAHFLIAQKEEI